MSSSSAQYKVVYATGAKCREGEDLSSRNTGDIPFDTIVTVEQIHGRRCRISSPMKGWVSMYTAGGEPVLQIVTNDEGNDNTFYYDDAQFVTIPLQDIDETNALSENQSVIKTESNTNSEADYVSDFKRKLHDPEKPVCKCINCRCCNLWIQAHLRLLANILVIIFLMFFVIVNIHTLHWMHYIFIVISFGEFVSSFFGHYGLYKCNVKCLVVISYWTMIECLFIMFIVYSIEALIENDPNNWWGWTLMAIVGILVFFIVWGSTAWRRAVNWAVYFSNGGVYDADMSEPPKE